MTSHVLTAFTATLPDRLKTDPELERQAIEFINRRDESARLQGAILRGEFRK